jgi:secretion-regulating guanine nucleotide exchange factor
MSESFACLVKVGEELKLFTWGWNEHGNLGLGDREDRSTPSPVNLKIGVGSKIFAGGAFLFATN